MNKAVFYLRTSSSTNVGDDKDSESRQKSVIESYANQHKYELVEGMRVSDLINRAGGVSGKTYFSRANITRTKSDDIKNELTSNILNERVYEKANSFYEKFLESDNLEASLKYVNLNKKSIKEVEINTIKNLNIEDNILSEEELAKIIFNLNVNGLSDPLESKNNNLFFIHLEKINKSVPKTFDVAKKEVIDSLYNKKKRQQSKKIADTIYSDIINEKQPKQVYLTSSKTSWITNDSRINDTLDPKIKNIIFKTKLNSYSKINQLEEFKYVFVKPTLQSEKYLSTEKRTKTENILTNIDSNIKNDIINALLVDIKIEKKSSINQNFINSF